MTMAELKGSVSADLIQLKGETSHWPKWSEDQPATTKERITDVFHLSMILMRKNIHFLQVHGSRTEWARFRIDTFIRTKCLANNSMTFFPQMKSSNLFNTLNKF